MKAKFKVPSDIEPEAKAYMKDVVSRLEQVEMLAKVDNAALMMLARNYSTFIKASKQIEIEGLTYKNIDGVINVHPLIKVARDAQVQAVKIMTEFGLTAKARTKLEKAAPPKDDNSPLEQFFKGGKEYR